MPTTEAPDNDWLAAANQRGFTSGHVNEEFAHLEALKSRLLSFGGWAVALRPLEPDLDAIMSRGVLLSGEDALQQPADENQCHLNVAMQHLLTPGAFAIMTGYALSPDGMWRQHSWLYDKASSNIVETTVPRVGYFGVLCEGLDALVFCTRNVPFNTETQGLVSRHPAYSEFIEVGSKKSQ